MYKSDPNGLFLAFEGAEDFYAPHTHFSLPTRTGSMVPICGHPPQHLTQL